MDKNTFCIGRYLVMSYTEVESTYRYSLSRFVADTVLYHFLINYYVLETWVANMKTREDAVKHVVKLYAVLGNSLHKDYTAHEAKVKKALLEHIKTGEV